MKKRKMFNIQNETLLVGCFYKNPDLYLEYGNYMRPKYDFYKSEEELKSDLEGEMEFWYNCFENMYRNYSTTFTERKINIFMSQDKNRMSRYKRLGGYNALKNMKDLSDIEDFNSYFDTVKKYGLIRELYRSGFPVEKILNHKKFDFLSGDKIQKIMYSKLNEIQTITGGGESSVKLCENAQSTIRNYTKKPSFGIRFPWNKWNESFRGWRKKKFIVEGMLSNEGKSRKMVLLATYVSIIEGETVLVMTNEMSEEDIEACQIVTIVNSPYFKDEFDFTLDKTEKEIVMGLYRDDITKKYLIRQEGMTDDEWEVYLFEHSTEYKNTLTVGQWIEDHSNIYFKEMNGRYSDIDLEMEIKKHVVSKGVTYFCYDTLKGFKTDGWEAIKQTATRLEEICKELDVGGYANFQLTDDSVYVDIFDFNSNNLANAKQVYHVLDFLCLDKRIYSDEYDKYLVEDSFGGEIELDKNKNYYGCKFAKSRTGNKGRVTLVEVDLDRNQWKEVGWLINKKRPENSSMKRSR